jgi:hypothetical protein
LSKKILIGGDKRAGKDYTALQLSIELNKRGYTTSIMRFADPMKFIIAETFGISLDALDEYKNDTELFGIELKVYPNNQPQGVIEYTDFRAILQRFGSEGMKPVFGSNIWAKLLYEKADKHDDIDFVIVPDFRFLVEYLPSATSIKVVNKLIEASKTDTHSSENELNDFKWDYSIDNTEQKDISAEINEIVDNILLEKKFNGT